VRSITYSDPVMERVHVSLSHIEKCIDSATGKSLSGAREDTA
jgi:hypothetical protein